MALEAEVVVFQSPPSFGASGEHERNLREFFGRIDRGGLALAWEPRGSWMEEPARVESVCSDLGIVHVVDVLREEPLAGDVVYTRLHGLNEDPYDYDYSYMDDELERLAGTLTELSEIHDGVYCLFNNYDMYRDASRLREEL